MAIKENLDKIKELDLEMSSTFKRLKEIGLIKVGLKILNASDAFYILEESFLETKLDLIKKQISELRQQEIIGINGETE